MKKLKIGMNEKGLTLIEMMISLALGIIIILSVIQIFLMINQLFLKQQGFCRIQENARIVNATLGKAIQSAGNFGCRSLASNIVLRIHSDIDTQAYGLFPFEGIKGVNKKSLLFNPLISSARWHRINSDSDIIWVKSLTKIGDLKFEQEERDYILGQLEVKLKPHQLIALFDCNQVDVLKVIKPTVLTSRLTQIFLKKNENLNLRQCRKTVKIGQIKSTFFYVGNTFRKNAKGNEIFSLYSTDLNDRTIEWIEGVESMKILYGVKTKDAILYYPHDKITKWEQVVSVRIKLLLTSVENAAIYSQKGGILRQWWVFEWHLKAMH